jgi:hypothetical protein
MRTKVLIGVVTAIAMENADLNVIRLHQANAPLGDLVFAANIEIHGDFSYVLYCTVYHIGVYDLAVNRLHNKPRTSDFASS